MPVAIAAVVMPIFMALISLGAVVAMIAILAKAGDRAGQRRQEIFNKVLESGVYDRSLLSRQKRGHGSLGWGIVLATTGIGLVIGFASLGILADAATGAVVPLCVGIGLIIFYVITRRMGSNEKENGEPVKLPGRPPAAAP